MNKFARWIRWTFTTMALALTLIASSLQASGLSPETTPEQSISNKTFASQTEPAVSHFNPIEPFNTGLYVIREQDKTQVNPGDALQYRITVENTTNLAINNIQLSELLPAGFHYETASAKFNGNLIVPDISSNGRQLHFNLGTLAEKTQAHIDYVVSIGAIHSGNYLSQSQATGNSGSIQSNISKLNVTLIDELMMDKAVIIGQVHVQGSNTSKDTTATLKGIRFYMEDGRYALTDDKGFFHFDHVTPGSHVVQLDTTTLPAGYSLVTDDLTTRHTGNAESELIDLQEGTIWRTDFSIQKIHDSALPQEKLKITETVTADTFNHSWLADKNDQPEWLFPILNTLPAAPGIDVVIKHGTQQTVTLTLNGKQVSANNIVSTISNNNGATITRWQGINLADGSNTLQAIIYQNDREISRLNLITHLSTAATQARVIKEKSTLLADGITQPVIAIRLTDKDGFPVRPGSSGDYRLGQPYLPVRDDLESLANMPGSPSVRDKYTVGDDGIAYIKLQPTTHAENVNISLMLANNQATLVEAKLHSVPREWIIVGLSEGSAGYHQIQRHVEPLNGSSSEHDLYSDGRVAFFARGKIKGEWLMTMAYDSNKQSINTTTNNLFQEFNPSSYYTIYGDSAYNGHDAPSSDKIYLKLEKEDYYVLFGDYNTGMNKTELTKYDRTFTGIKSRYQRDGVDIIVFSSDTDQIFLKQQIRGEGHSGPYRLQGKNIALNSERITLEVRDRYRSEIVLETHTLTRYADYDINYMDGTLTFREPVFSVNPDLNPQFIIVRYESIDSSQGGNITGGRSEKQVSDNTRIGISFVNEDYVGEKSTLYGVDIQQRISENTRLRLESANIYSEEIFMSRNKDAANYVELNHQSSRWNIRTYARTQDDGFGLGQADISENATKKAGIDSNYRATERININTQANYQQLTLSQAERSLIQTEGQYRFTGGHASLGARAVQELPADGQVLDTQQITSGIRKELFDNKIAVKLNHDHNLGDNNIDYPNKTVSGIDYNFSRTTTLFVEHELADSELRSTQSTLIGVKTSPWKGGEIYTGIRQRQDNTNESTTANAALKQKIVLTNALSISFGMEQSKLVSQHTAEPINPNAPYAVGGSEEFTAVSAGMTYAPGGWTWSGRGEARVASSEYRALLQSSLKTAIGSDLTLLTGLRSNYAQQRLIRSHQTDHDLSLGLAYRPINSRWTVFDKLALRIEENRGEFDTEEQRIVNLLSLNYRQRPWQVSMQYGAKTVGHTIGSLSYDNVVELIGSELRRDINPRWDIGVHGRVLRASLQQQQDYNHGFSVGHTFDKYIWLSTGYNFSGFVDKDYSRNNVTRAGPYIQFRMNFDQHSVRQLFQSEPDSDRQ